MNEFDLEFGSNPPLEVDCLNMHLMHITQNPIHVRNQLVWSETISSKHEER